MATTQSQTAVRGLTAPEKVVLDQLVNPDGWPKLVTGEQRRLALKALRVLEARANYLSKVETKMDQRLQGKRRRLSARDAETEEAGKEILAKLHKDIKDARRDRDKRLKMKIEQAQEKLDQTRRECRIQPTETMLFKARTTENGVTTKDECIYVLAKDLAEAVKLLNESLIKPGAEVNDEILSIEMVCQPSALVGKTVAVRNKRNRREASDE